MLFVSGTRGGYNQYGGYVPSQPQQKGWVTFYSQTLQKVIVKRRYSFERSDNLHGTHSSFKSGACRTFILSSTVASAQLRDYINDVHYYRWYYSPSVSLWCNFQHLLMIESGFEHFLWNTNSTEVISSATIQTYFSFASTNFNKVGLSEHVIYSWDNLRYRQCRPSWE